ncbi:universal stress protein [Actinoallomurus iriomotensis]|uniref:Universal stress protein n=1 Tax=Actinoallomurus iriomotensis TaxID=478107 RepID=A0A9W6SAY3_9ACTN|nr:universal stress protein [Actinoallomurus iriomotensis]GLY88917.1 universal stress protein [Actinoallomurus iriomotensis]
MNKSVVVGVDGSAAALYAVDWAAAEAGRRRLPLRIVHVTVRWEYDVEAPAESGMEAARPEAAGLQVLRVAEERARTFASLRVDCRLGVGPIPLTLLQEAEDAALLVLGPHGTGGLTRLLLGSVSRQAAEHAPCPVVIVPHDTDTRPRRPEIVVGVDGSAGSVDAVGFALEEASLRAVGLRAIHAWTHPAYPPEMRPVHYDGAAVEREGARLLSESLAGWRSEYPDVPVLEQVTQGAPADVLTEASGAAELLVLGARGRGGFPGLRVGSVSHAVLHHTRGPLIVVRRAGCA